MTTLSVGTCDSTTGIADSGYSVYICAATTANGSLILPDAVSQNGSEMSFTRTDSVTANTFSLVPTGGQLLDGSTGPSYLPVQSSVTTFASNGNWHLRSSHNSNGCGFFVGATGPAGSIALTVAAGGQTVIPTYITATTGNWTDGNFGTTTGVYTVATAGVYMATAQVFIPGSLTAAFLSNGQLNLRRGAGPTPNAGTDVTIATAFPSQISVIGGLVSLGIAAVTLDIICLPVLTAGQIVYLVLQNTGSGSMSTTISGVPTQTFFSMHRLH